MTPKGEFGYYLGCHVMENIKNFGVIPLKTTPPTLEPGLPTRKIMEVSFGRGSDETDQTALPTKACKEA